MSKVHWERRVIFRWISAQIKPIIQIYHDTLTIGEMGVYQAIDYLKLENQTLKSSIVSTSEASSIENFAASLHKSGNHTWRNVTKSIHAYVQVYIFWSKFSFRQETLR